MLRRLVRLLRDEDAVHRRRSLEPGCRVDHITGGHRLASIGSCVERDQRLAGRDSDPKLDPVLFGKRANGERGANRALGVVLMRGGSAEQRHHGVTDELLDSASVPLELLFEPRVIRPEESGDILGVHLLGALGEPHEVAEENRDDLALLAPRIHEL